MKSNENESWKNYLLRLLVSNWNHSGLALGLLAMGIVGHLIMMLLLLFGYGDWVPMKYHWLVKLFFWK
jgi:hypothetical protein